MQCGEVSLSSGWMENAIGRGLRYFLGCPSRRFFFFFASDVEKLTWELSFRWSTYVSIYLYNLYRGLSHGVAARLTVQAAARLGWYCLRLGDLILLENQRVEYLPISFYTHRNLWNVLHLHDQLDGEMDWKLRVGGCSFTCSRCSKRLPRTVHLHSPIFDPLLVYHIYQVSCFSTLVFWQTK